MHATTTEPEPREVGPTQPPPRRSRGDRVLAVVLIAAAFVLANTFPGDLPFFDDQVSLVGNALKANADRRLADFGLGGTHNATYGPLPTQFYQLLLLFTHDLPTMIRIRATVFVAVTVIALWSLARTLSLPRWFVGFVVCCPWVWFFYRDLWDNTFTLPLGCIAVAAYARWLAKPSRFNATLWPAAAVAMPLVHLSAVAVPAALLGCALIFRFTQFRRSIGWMALGAAVACSTSVPYIAMTARQRVDLLAMQIAGYNPAPADAVQADAWRKAQRAGRLRSATHALGAAVLLNGRLRVFDLDDRLALARIASYAAFPSHAVHAWLAVGAIVGVGGLFIRRHRQAARTHTACAAVSAIVLLAGIFASVGAQWIEHYVNGVFAAMICLCWIGADHLWKRGLVGRMIVIVPAIATLACTWLMLGLIHQSHGGRGVYGPTVGNLIQIAAAVRGRADAMGYVNHPQMVGSPQALWLVRQLTRDTPAPTAQSADGRFVVVRLAEAFPGDGRVVVTFADTPPDGAFVPVKLLPEQVAPPH